MTEIWDTYHASTASRERLRADLCEIAKTCEADQTSHITQNAVFYERFLSRWRRYFESQGDNWFTGRQSFLRALDEMFPDAKAFKIDPHELAVRANDEKKKWYIDFLKQSVVPIIPEGTSEKGSLLKKLDEKDVPVEQLVSVVTKALGGHAAQIQPDDVASFLSRVAPPADKKSRIEAYRGAILAKGHGDMNQATSTAIQKYLKMAEDGMSMDRIIGAFAADEEAEDEKHRAKKDEVEEHLEMLLRAQSALERKMKQKADRQAARAAVAERQKLQQQLLDGLFDNLPACFTCEKNVDGKDLVWCVFCQLLSGLWSIGGVTIYCDMECHDQGFSSHERDHQCSAYQWCIGEGDQSIDGPGYGSVFCAECVQLHKLPTTYCSSRCFANDFQRHREQVHIPRRESLQFRVDDSDNLKYLDEAVVDKGKYARTKSDTHGEQKPTELEDRAQDPVQQTLRTEERGDADKDHRKPANGTSDVSREHHEQSEEQGKAPTEESFTPGIQLQPEQVTGQRNPEPNQPDGLQHTNDQSSGTRQQAGEQTPAVGTERANEEDKQPKKDEPNKIEADLQQAVEEHIKAEEEQPEKDWQGREQAQQTGEPGGNDKELEKSGDTNCQGTEPKQHVIHGKKEMSNTTTEDKLAHREDQSLANGPVMEDVNMAGTSEQDRASEPPKMVAANGEQTSTEEQKKDAATDDSSEQTGNQKSQELSKEQRPADRLDQGLAPQKQAVVEDVEMGGVPEPIETQETSKEKANGDEPILTEKSTQDLTKQSESEDVEMGGTNEQQEGEEPLTEWVLNGQEGSLAEKAEPSGLDQGQTQESAGQDVEMGDIDEQVDGQKPLQDEARSESQSSTATVTDENGSGQKGAETEDSAGEQADLDGQLKEHNPVQEPASIGDGPTEKRYIPKNMDKILITMPAAMREWEEKFGTSIGDD